jgi:hypothetical protein
MLAQTWLVGQQVKVPPWNWSLIQIDPGAQHVPWQIWLLQHSAPLDTIAQ